MQQIQQHIIPQHNAALAGLWPNSPEICPQNGISLLALWSCITTGHINTSEITSPKPFTYKPLKWQESKMPKCRFRLWWQRAINLFEHMAMLYIYMLFGWSGERWSVNWGRWWGWWSVFLSHTVLWQMTELSELSGWLLTGLNFTREVVTAAPLSFYKESLKSSIGIKPVWFLVFCV